MGRAVHISYTQSGRYEQTSKATYTSSVMTCCEHAYMSQNLSDAAESDNAYTYAAGVNSAMMKEQERW
jgi:hypothetical protein